MRRIITLMILLLFLGPGYGYAMAAEPANGQPAAPVVAYSNYVRYFVKLADEQGRPFDHAKISAYYKGCNDIAESVETDAAGKARFDKLLPGQGYVFVASLNNSKGPGRLSAYILGGYEYDALYICDSPEICDDYKEHLFVVNSSQYFDIVSVKGDTTDFVLQQPQLDLDIVIKNDAAAVVRLYYPKQLAWGIQNHRYSHLWGVRWFYGSPGQTIYVY